MPPTVPSTATPRSAPPTRLGLDRRGFLQGVLGTAVLLGVGACAKDEASGSTASTPDGSPADVGSGRAPSSRSPHRRASTQLPFELAGLIDDLPFTVPEWPNVGGRARRHQRLPGQLARAGLATPASRRSRPTTRASTSRSSASPTTASPSTCSPPSRAATSRASRTSRGRSWRSRRVRPRASCCCGPSTQAGIDLRRRRAGAADQQPVPDRAAGGAGRHRPARSQPGAAVPRRSTAPTAPGRSRPTSSTCSTCCGRRPRCWPTRPRRRPSPRTSRCGRRPACGSTRTPQAWIDEYYVATQNLPADEAARVVELGGKPEFPPSWDEAVAWEQETVDLLAAGGFVDSFDAEELFDRRFESLAADAVAAPYTNTDEPYEE